MTARAGEIAGAAGWQGSGVAAGGRYEVMGGLRGTAALLVVALHMMSTFRPGALANPLHHGYLAVDFFFMLSGFVVGHAYDGRWSQMGLGGFFARRLIRLHPLVVVGALLGAASYLAAEIGIDGDPFWLRRFVENLLLAALLLPAPAPPGLVGMTHAFNPPSWSLTQEYLANVAYGLAGRRLGRAGLKAVVAASAVALAVLGAVHGTVDVGWGWDNLWLGPVRTAFPFFAGLLLQRSGVHVPLPGGWVTLSLVLVAAFAAPVLPTVAGVKLNGLFEAGLVLLVFPLVVVAGAAGPAGGVAARLCRLAGEISYPIYIVHAPILHVYAAWVAKRPDQHRLALVGGGLLGAVLPLIAWGVLKLYDEPVRAALAHRVLRRSATPMRPPGAPAER